MVLGILAANDKAVALRVAMRSNFEGRFTRVLLQSELT
jgi:hypothetical protein